MSFSIPAMRQKLAGLKGVMIDLETFDTEPSAAWYALAAREFVFGQDPGEPEIDADDAVFDVESPDFLLYVEPTIMLQHRKFTRSEATLTWTLGNNMIELERAYRQGMDPYTAMSNFRQWMLRVNPDYIVANSPSFDCMKVHHSCNVLDIPRDFCHYQKEFDVRTLRTVLEILGHPKYGPKENTRLHSPLDDCTLQIRDLNRFFDVIEGGHMDATAE